MPSDLLSESDIISEEEKQGILAEIDKSFMGRSQEDSDLSQIFAKSNGLTLPFAIAALAIISTFLILLFSNNIIVQNSGIPPLHEFTIISGSEWEILKIYMQESTIKLESKNSEIGKYKEEIVSYDRRLTTLRELLKVKEDAENRLAVEREKLKIEGIAEEEIASKITILEETLISELAPDMIVFYNLSIDDLNKQINQVLNDKTRSEEKLKTSIVEREVLVTENEKIQEEVKVKEAEITLVPEVIEIMNKMNKIADQYEYEKLIRNQIDSLYNEIFQSMDHKEYHTALEKIDELQNLLQNSTQADEQTAISQLAMQIKMADTLKEYINKSLVTADLALSKKYEYENKIEESTEIIDPDKSLDVEDTTQSVDKEKGDSG
ncbi:MAG: hypothetical protein KAR21_24085, partial [Spirochaetales bacterium]|nr:hypothetical protein [Spirochaetales bacterium]